MTDAASGTWPTFATIRAFGPAENSTRRLGRGRPEAACRHLRSRQHRRRPQSLSASQWHVFAGKRAFVRRRRQLSANADDSFRRHAQSRFLQRRDRSTDDRAARVSTTTRRVPPVLRARAPRSSMPLQGRARRPAPTSTASNLVFYSPSVGPFDSGAKVEGTFGDQSFGALTFHGYDETTNNTFSDQAYGYEHALPNGSVHLLERRRFRQP